MAGMAARFSGDPSASMKNNRAFSMIDCGNSLNHSISVRTRAEGGYPEPNSRRLEELLLSVQKNHVSVFDEMVSD
jgi:hypothetical protein